MAQRKNSSHMMRVAPLHASNGFHRARPQRSRARGEGMAIDYQGWLAARKLPEAGSGARGRRGMRILPSRSSRRHD